MNTSTQWILALLLFFTSNLVTQAQTLDATFSSPSAVQCAGSLFTLNATTTTHQGYTWTIEGPNNFSSTISGSSSALNLTEPGTYNVSLSVTDGVITTNNSSIGYLMVDAPPTVNAGVDQIICANSFATLNGSFGGTATSISWSGGSGAFSPNNAILSAIYSPSFSEIANGFVNLILTTNDPAGPCSAVSDTVMILFNSLPTVTAPAYFCEGSSAQLSPSSGGAWTSSNAFIASISGSGIATGTSAGNVIFTFTNNATGCSNNTSTVTINSLPIVSSPSSICVGTTGQLSPATGGTWVSNNSSIATVSGIGLVTGLSPGIVSFIFTDAATGCSTTSSNLTVPIDGPLGTITVNNTNLTGCSCFNASITVTTSGATEAKILYNDGQFVQLTPNTTQTVNYSYCNTGGSTITRTPTLYISNGTCETFIQSSQTININPIPTVYPIPDQIVCAGDSITAIAFSGSGQQYNWTNDNTNTGLAASGTGNIAGFVATNPVFESISTITVTPESNGCGATSTTFTITVKFAPTVFPVVDQIICQDQGTQTINFSGTNPNTTYEWVHSNQAIGLLSAGTDFIPSFPAQNASSFPLISTFTVTPSLNGCFGTAINFAISVNPSSTVDPIPDQIACAGELISSITFSGSHPNTTYNWVQDNTSIGASSFGAGNIPSFQAQNQSSGSQIAMFIVTPFLEGCTGISDTFLISVNPLPLINAGNDTVLCSGESFTPIASGTFSLIVWNNGVFDGTPFTPTVTETYIATGTDMNCSNSDSITVTINSVPQLTISTFNGEDSLACDGTLSVLVTDGIAPYSHTWTNGASNYTTATIQNLCSGTYALSVVDANGCSATNLAVINDTLIPVIVGDTLIFTDNIYQDSTIIGADTSDWIENCTFDYDLVTSATISSYVDNGSSTIVTWLISLSDGSTIPIEATYYLSPGTAGVYDLTLQLTCSQKSDPKFLVANSRLYYEGSTIGIQSNSLSAILLYPNPANSTLSISGINESFQFEIRDIQGKLLKQGGNDKQIDIEHLPAGTYVIGISTDNEVKQLRFVKI
jgi:hypothetical protein